MATDVFPFLEIFMPLVSFGVAVLCCTSLCKSCHRDREEQLDRTDTPSIFVIPIPTDDRIHNPPRYSTTGFYSPPPPYAEVEMKPELFPFPEGLPPAYTEVSPSSPTPPLPPPLPHSTTSRRMSYV